MIIDKVELQKHKPLLIDEHLTEWEYMQINGYNRIWDCGRVNGVY